MRIQPFSLVLGFSLALLLGVRQVTTTASVASLTPAQQEVLALLSVVQLDDGAGGTQPTLRVSGANLQVVNGLGLTATTNGVGNLIVGYNELGNPGGDQRSGSHNLVAGRSNSYGNYGGVVAGEQNTLVGRFANVTGGVLNVASGDWSHVTGGGTNESLADLSTINGGVMNVTNGPWSSIAGGFENETTGQFAAVGGGTRNLAAGFASAASGGVDNRALGDVSAVSGGGGNTSYAAGCSVSGGQNNTAGTAGGFVGDYASVSGGLARSALDFQDWAAGSLSEPN